MPGRSRRPGLGWNPGRQLQRWLLGTGSALGLASGAASVEVQVEQITPFSHLHSLGGARNGRLAFTGLPLLDRFVLGSGDLFVWDGESVSRITDDDPETGPDDTSPDFYGSRLVWVRGVEQADQELVFLDSGRILPFTGHDHPETGVRASNSLVAWTARPDTNTPQGEEIFVFDGARILRLTTNDYADFFVAASETQVAWQGFPEEYSVAGSEIFLWDGHVTHRLTDDDAEDTAPRLSGERVVWERFDGEDYEIVLYDGDGVEQLTDNEYDDLAASLSGERIAWEGRPDGGREGEIFLYDRGIFSRLTENTELDRAPSVSSAGVAWIRLEGPAGTPSSFASARVVLHDGVKTREIAQTVNGRVEYSVRFLSESSFAWLGQPDFPDEGDPRDAVFVATFVPEPSTTLLGVSALTTLRRLTRRRARA